MSGVTARSVSMAVLLACVSACGGGGSGGGSSTAATTGGGTPAGPAVTMTEAYRFLNQATFGATEASAQQLIAMGDNTNAYGRWIDQQLAMPATTGALAATVAAFPTPVPTGFNIASLHGNRVDSWLANALTAGDQLRQRVAFALSEIMVTSQIGALQTLPFAAADYYDMLARDALGDFRVLLEDVTLHPAMGIYLSMLGNQKANAATNIRPDENYARELMQLMSIGLIELNMDGTARLDASGAQIPTYNQNIIEGFARVYTGWKWACPSTNQGCTFATTRAELAPVANFNQVKPMQFYSDQHEIGTKQVLSYTGAAKTVIPASQTGAQDLKDALDNVFNHPNVAPFIARQLIQKLVTSNPSPAYVQRVAQVFANDGAGKRGNLAAVVKALLLDTEARTTPAGAAIATTGKVKEPMLRITQFWRAYNAHAASGRITATGNFIVGGALSPSATTGQGPLQSGSVFNFFSPFYAPPGEIANAGNVAPELQLATEFLNTQMTNQFYTYAFQRTSAQSTLGADIIFIDTTSETAAAADAAALVNRVADRLLGSNTLLSATLRSETLAQVNRSAASAAATRVGDAIYLISSSPEYGVLR
jgi:uncharacterized protein (DUF1800 family)